MPDPLSGPRLRQVALVAHDCENTATALRETFGWPDPFHDPGVGEFGLVNAVFAVGDSFVEVVSPVQPDTTAGRYLARRGSDSGYMAIFQMPSLEEARRRVNDLGVRVVWKVDLDDIAGTHLHPKDTPGAIVSLDWASPTDSWRWAGPAWTGTVPDHPAGGIAGITVEVQEPAEAARRWARVLGLDAEVEDGVAHVRLDPAGQSLRFVPSVDGRAEGITEIWLTPGLPGLPNGSGPVAEIGGVHS
ncbi:VOC family protein [Mycobacterium fragae]|uniref:VOC family protein n=1 Tax=Mycobacterium fragae TaxID=1260918 RepID=UPI00111C8F39|nr:VOC family protein [Mycobacterium fragae]MCV7400445.1 VOC family protein [Mycobacterium fragae]